MVLFPALCGNNDPNFRVSSAVLWKAPEVVAAGRVVKTVEQLMRVQVRRKVVARVR